MAFWPPRRLWITIRRWRRPEDPERAVLAARLAEAEGYAVTTRPRIWGKSQPPNAPGTGGLPPDEADLFAQLLKGDDS